MKELYELQDKACEALGMVLKKGNMNPNDWQLADHITATLKNIEKTLAYKQGGGQSHRGYAHDGSSQAGRWQAEGEYGSGRSHNGGSYGSYNQSMSGYSHNSYSHHGKQMLEQLKEMRRSANEQEKAMLDRWISEASSF